MKPFHSLPLLASWLPVATSRRMARPMQFPPPGVTVLCLLATRDPGVDEFTGRIDAIETVEIRPRVSGYLDQVHFKSGQMVKKGDLLFTIDPRPFQRRWIAPMPSCNAPRPNSI